jgi:hypothetical protein
MEGTLETTGLVFDAGALFAVGPPLTRPTDVITLSVPSRITFRSLHLTATGQNFISQDDWNEVHRWGVESTGPGIYRIGLPVPDSNLKTFDQQRALLRHDEDVAPLALLALAFLCRKEAGYCDPLNGGWVRCKETMQNRHIIMYWLYGRLHMGVDARECFDQYAYDHVWMASVRKV